MKSYFLNSAWMMVDNVIARVLVLLVTVVVARCVAGRASFYNGTRRTSVEEIIWLVKNMSEPHRA
ncbi:hypothetical protein EJ066_16740 [Mesorhizobium sp. M9A.F.Ca.ET.002.03.1.2]|uniref:hypothetical protein n=1 Tax=Mesorhizobium sp. M9A.F.Ca.ET.002.03.1.2 TaxID=2493668 RepID=UPI000F75DA82|nr:hypothetical protein [Mesorhizobium sp. M9A.F.Ca.ET.002.03.1.2]AZN98678.1 hypothetical protein EJ066_16740 [Mesorhizobium sp. M9A.F.Ca.ET.002.03.1.2]